MDNDKADELIEALRGISAAITENTELIEGELSGIRHDLQAIKNMLGAGVDQMIANAPEEPNEGDGRVILSD